MTDNYEIEIEPGEEMQLDDAGAQNVNRKGRGFGNNSGEAQLGRNGSGRLGSAGNPAHATAVRSIEGWIVLVTGVHEEASEEDILQFFSEFGEIQQTHLNLDRRTGYVKGYALLEYATLEEAKAAIAGAQGQKILEQPIHADFAFIRGPKADRPERGNRFGGGRGGNRRARSQSPGVKEGEGVSLEARIAD